MLEIIARIHWENLWVSWTEPLDLAIGAGYMGA